MGRKERERERVEKQKRRVLHICPPQSHVPSNYVLDRVRHCRHNLGMCVSVFVFPCVHICVCPCVCLPVNFCVCLPNSMCLCFCVCRLYIRVCVLLPPLCVYVCVLVCPCVHLCSELLAPCDDITERNVGALVPEGSWDPKRTLTLCIIAFIKEQEVELNKTKQTKTILCSKFLNSCVYVCVRA